MATDKATGNEAHIESAGEDINRLQDVDLNDKSLNREALEATADEHSLTFLQAMKTYKRAAFWSICKCDMN